MSFGWKYSHKNLKAKLWFIRKATPSQLKELFFNKIFLGAIHIWCHRFRGGGGSAIRDVLLNFYEVSKEKNVTKGGGVQKSIFTVTSCVDGPLCIEKAKC